MDAELLRLVAITDDLRDGADGLVRRACAAAEGGATLIQLRLKHVDARELVEIARRLVAELPVPLIVNDRADVAIAAGAGGVHLGADDLPVAAARAIAPAGFLIGASVGNDEEADAVSGADYVGIGPLFATASKADAGEPLGASRFAALRARCAVPCVAIGGIDATNVAAARAAGADGVAVIRAVFSAADVRSAARALRSASGS